MADPSSTLDQELDLTSIDMNSMGDDRSFTQDAKIRQPVNTAVTGTGAAILE